jgi:hypothetical protein
MTRTRIFVCRDPLRAEWQLGPLPPAAGRMMLIGWKQEPEPVDGGVPAAVAAVLTRALTSLGRVTFPSSMVQASATSGWSRIGSDDVRGLAAPFTGRVAAAMKGTPGHVVLVSTTDSETARQAFDDPGYPWWMQGQVLLMSASNAAPPDIDREQLLALLDQDWARGAERLARSGIAGILRPGVDGDLAALLTVTGGVDDASLAALEREARLASFGWSVVAEEAFALH